MVNLVEKQLGFRSPPAGQSVAKSINPTSSRRKKEPSAMGNEGVVLGQSLKSEWGVTSWELSLIFPHLRAVGEYV